jgi:hypothetical protein
MPLLSPGKLKNQCRPDAAAARHFLFVPAPQAVSVCAHSVRPTSMNACLLRQTAQQIWKIHRLLVANVQCTNRPWLCCCQKIVAAEAAVSVIGCAVRRLCLNQFKLVPPPLVKKTGFESAIWTLSISTNHLSLQAFCSAKRLGDDGRP